MASQDWTLQTSPPCSPGRPPSHPSLGALEPYLVQLIHLGLACHICFIICKHFEPETGDRELGHCGRW